MQEENNFILKIHIKNDDLKEVFLNKDRRCFLFLNDNCVEDLVLPNFKLTSLKMLIKNVTDSEENDNCYAEYYGEDNVIKEYDKDKIELLVKLVTTINLNDFLDFVDLIKINEFYVDNLVDKYNSIFPEEVKHLISYTTNGVVIDEKNEISILSHEDILNCDSIFLKKKFIPIFKKFDTFVGYDLNDDKYAIYSNGEKVKTNRELSKLLRKDGAKNKEKKDSLDKHTDYVENLFDENATLIEVEKDDIEQEEKEKHNPQRDLDSVVKEELNNIDLQFDRLNTRVEGMDLDGDNNIDTYKLASSEKVNNKYFINIEDLFSSIKNKLENKYYINLGEILNNKENNEQLEKCANKYYIDLSKIINDTHKVSEIKELNNKYYIDLNKILKLQDSDIKLDELDNKYYIDLKKILTNNKEEESVRELNNKYIIDLNKLFETQSEKEEIYKNKYYIDLKNIIDNDDDEGKIKELNNKYYIDLKKMFALDNTDDDELDSVDNKYYIDLKKILNNEEKENGVKELNNKYIINLADILNIHHSSKTNKLIDKYSNKYYIDLKNIIGDTKIESEIKSLNNKYYIDLKKILKLKDKKEKLEDLNNKYYIDLDGILYDVDKKAELRKLNNKYYIDLNNCFGIHHSTSRNDEKYSGMNKYMEAFHLTIEELMKKPTSTKKKTNNKDSIMDKVSKFEVNEVEVKNISSEKVIVDRDESKEFVNTFPDKLKEDLIESIRCNLSKLEKQENKEKIAIEDLITDSFNNSIANYRINFNDTNKIVVEHLPYYKNDLSFGVVQIPDIELDKKTLIPGDILDFGKFKLSVKEISKNIVTLVFTKVINITDKDGKRFKRGSILKLSLDNDINLRLDERNAMETWTLRMEKGTFTKELRNIEYNKLLNYIRDNTKYNSLINLEKYETQKSLMLFMNFIMKNDDEKTLSDLYDMIYNDPENYEEFVTKYNMDNSYVEKDALPSYDAKKDFLIKLNYVRGLIDAGWLDYPRYIFNFYHYMKKDELLINFIEVLNDSIKENDFYDYLVKLFKNYNLFNELDNVGKDNLKKCLKFLSLVYKKYPDIGEDYKYKIERSLMIGSLQEDMALLISKLCRRGIKDFASFRKYDIDMKEKYRIGELRYPLYSNEFDIDNLRNGGEYNEY